MPRVERTTAWHGDAEKTPANQTCAWTRAEQPNRVTAALLLTLVTLLHLPLAHGQVARGAPAPTTPPQEPIAVIVHPQNPLTNISLQELRAIFLRHRTRWPGNKNIVIINWSALSPTRVAFDRLVLKMSPDEVSAFWIDRRIRGLGVPPRSLLAPRLILAIVARIKETITYLPLSLVSKKVKVLRVDGVLPGDSRYLIRLGSQP